MKIGDTIKYFVDNGIFRTIQKGKVIDISEYSVLVTDKTNLYGCTLIDNNQIICVYKENNKYE